jgi:hypothetical protein
MCILKGSILVIKSITWTSITPYIFSSCFSNEMESKVSVSETPRPVHGPCQYHHPLMISSIYVLKALKEFLARYNIHKARWVNT